MPTGRILIAAHLELQKSGTSHSMYENMIAQIGPTNIQKIMNHCVSLNQSHPIWWVCPNSNRHLSE